MSEKIHSTDRPILGKISTVTSILGSPQKVFAICMFVSFATIGMTVGMFTDVKKDQKTNRDSINQLRGSRNSASTSTQIPQQVTNDLNQLKTIVGQLSSNISELKTNNSQLSTNVNQLKANLSQLKANNSQLSSELIQLKTNSSKISSDISQLKNNSNQTSSNLTQLKTTQDQLKTNLTNTSNVLEAVSTKLNNSIQPRTIYPTTGLIIYEDVSVIYANSTIQKSGTPIEYDDSFAVVQNRKAIYIGTSTNEGTWGLKVNIPPGYNLLGVRGTHGFKQQYCLRAIYSDDLSEIGVYCGGKLGQGITISPDNSIGNSYKIYQKWFYIPVLKEKAVTLSSKYDDGNKNAQISGISFGRNDLWNYIINPIWAYHNAYNGGTNTTGTVSASVSIQYLKILGGFKYDFYVPIIPNGKDKMLFITLNFGLYGETLTEIKEKIK